LDSHATWKWPPSDSFAGAPRREARLTHARGRRSHTAGLAAASTVPRTARRFLGALAAARLVTGNLSHRLALNRVPEPLFGPYHARARCLPRPSVPCGKAQNRSHPTPHHEPIRGFSGGSRYGLPH